MDSGTGAPAPTIVLGGPAMLIGLGGGAASSMASGQSDADLDFASVQRQNPEMERRWPGVKAIAFGHLGDGNMHFNVSQPLGMDKAHYLNQWHAMNDVVFDVVHKHGGSISAEHGIGQLKRDDMAKIKSPVELAMMRGIKALLDPKGIMNPGKVLPSA